MKVQIPNDAKMKELILYVAAVSAMDEKFGAVKLNKLLFYADFLSYLKRGKSITGQEYFALDEGPAPKRLVPIREQMCDKGELAIQPSIYCGFPQNRIVGLRLPDYSKLDAEDIAIVNFIVGKFRDKNGTELSEESHKFAGWKSAHSKGQKQIIPYSSVRFDVNGFLGMELPLLPEELVEHGKRLHRKLSRTNN